MFNLLADSTAPFDVKTIFSNVKSEWYYYVTLLAIVALVVLFALYFRPKKAVKLQSTKKLTMIAVMTSLAVVANICAFGSNLWKVSFVPVVCFVSGFIFGPINGFIIGFLGDLIGAIIFPQGVYNPIIAVASGLWGFFPGFIFNNFKGDNFWKTLISFFISFIVCSVCLNTIATYLMYLRGVSAKYTTLISYLLYRLGPSFITSFLLNACICIVILTPVANLKKHIVSHCAISPTVSQA